MSHTWLACEAVAAWDAARYCCENRGAVVEPGPPLRWVSIAYSSKRQCCRPLHAHPHFRPCYQPWMNKKHFAMATELHS